VVSTVPATATARPGRAWWAGWMLDGLAVALAILWLWMTSIPVQRKDELLALLFLSAVGVLIGWLVRTVVLLYRVAKHQQSIRPQVVRVLLIPALALLTSALLAAGASRQARFQLSRAALDRAAERVIRNDPLAPRAGDRVGLYRVSAVHAIPGGAHILLEGSGDILSPCGLGYRPAGPPAGLPFPDQGRGWPNSAAYIEYHDHLDGPWYEVCEPIT
jgi:hypothetical protein